MNLRVGSKWVLRKRIGAGSFGEIYSGEHTSGKETIAVKLEQTNANPPQLSNEFRAYRVLAGGTGIPSIRWYGVEGDYNVLVMELLGKSLGQLCEECGGKFGLKTVLMIADQMLARIEYLHGKNMLHRDIKPENFVVGTGLTSNLVYVIDLGLSKKYRDPRTGQHVPFREGKSLLGTARFTSINTHLGIEQSRRDDLEGIAYVLIFFLRGGLPWIGLKGETKAQKHEAIAEKKLTTEVDVLCQDLPAEFGMFLTEVRRLEFTDRPDYAGYRQSFRDLFLRQGYCFDYIYDWVEGQPVKALIPVSLSSPPEPERMDMSGMPTRLLEIGRRKVVLPPMRKTPVVRFTGEALGRKALPSRWVGRSAVRIPQAIRV
jgi:serine/threonine protein kinase